MADQFNNVRDRQQHVVNELTIDNLRGDMRPVVFEARRDGVAARLVAPQKIEELIRRLKSTEPVGR